MSRRPAAPGGDHDLLHDAEEAVLELWRGAVHTLDDVLRLPEPAHSRWHRAGVSARGERLLDRAGAALLITFAAGWSWAIATSGSRTGGAGADVLPVTRALAASLTSRDGPTAPFVTDALLDAVVLPRGASGRLRAVMATPGQHVTAGSAPAGSAVEFRPAGAGSAAHVAPAAAPAAPRRSGVWQVALRLGNAIRPITDFNVITLVPLSAKRAGRVGTYNIGSWPTEGGRAASPARGSADKYAPPVGFIEVTPENQDTYVSEHFRLRDFLTKDQRNVWPKYLVLRTELLDKLELVLAELEARGVQTRGVRVMSGFRTPQYNSGGGDPRGRAGLSRHMYGDAADVYIDNDGDGSMDDLNGDGRVNMRDAEMMQAAVDAVDRRHPALVGGCGVYPGNSAHGPFAHIDTRGYRARWVGSGDGG